MSDSFLHKRQVLFNASYVAVHNDVYMTLTGVLWQQKGHLPKKSKTMLISCGASF